MIRGGLRRGGWRGGRVGGSEVGGFVGLWVSRLYGGSVRLDVEGGLCLGAPLVPEMTGVSSPTSAALQYYRLFI